MNMTFSAKSSTNNLFKEVISFIEKEGFTITETDQNRPWGGFLVIAESQATQFISRFFPEADPDDFSGFSKLSPKILLVAPGKRLSWQYHHRREEIWRVISGQTGVIISETDKQTKLQQLTVGAYVELKQGQRHRLVGLDEWGVIAEIWKHTDPDYPSDEDDIIRLQDDFGREK